MKRTVLAIGAIGFILSAWMIGSALASSLTDTSQTVGAGKAAVARCETGGVTTLYNAGTTVTSVIVSNIASGCAGATMKVTVNNHTTTSSGSGTVPAGGGSLTVNVTSIVLTQSMQNEISVT